jgi:hypothetical protein
MDLTSSVSRSAVARRLLTRSHQTPVCLAFAVRSDTWSRQDALRNPNVFRLVWMARPNLRAALYLQARRRIVSHSDTASHERLSVTHGRLDEHASRYNCGMAHESSTTNQHTRHWIPTRHGRRELDRLVNAVLGCTMRGAPSLPIRL